MSEESHPVTDQIETELSKKLFHLKTLYDVSRELIGLDSIEAIAHVFLMMSTGNFGILQGFMQLHDRRAGSANTIEIVGIQDSEQKLLEQVAGRLLIKDAYQGDGIKILEERHRGFLPEFIDQMMIFEVSNSCTGVLGLGPKIMGDPFSDADLDLLETLVNNLIAALKNAMATEALKDAYQEVSTLNRAKDKVINHLSHELKTPIALLGGSLGLLKRALAEVPGKKWKRIIVRAERSLQRLSGLQQEASDIMQIRSYDSGRMICDLLDQCSDELETLIDHEAGEKPVAERVRKRIDAIFDVQPALPEEIALDKYVTTTLETIRSEYSHRKLDLRFAANALSKISMPTTVITKVIRGLVKNAIENTPDGGKIKVSTTRKGDDIALEVRDYGVGILQDHQTRIFQGFFPTQRTDAYSSKRPFDFNAGGKGADLLRMKIFSERFGFSLDYTSERCPHLPTSKDICPGAVHLCNACHTPEDCFNAGGSSFRIIFPSNSIA